MYGQEWKVAHEIATIATAREVKWQENWWNTFTFNINVQYPSHRNATHELEVFVFLLLSAMQLV